MDFLETHDVHIHCKERTVSFNNLTTVPMLHPRDICQRTVSLISACTLAPRAEHLLPVMVPQQFVYKTILMEALPAAKDQSYVVGAILVHPQSRQTVCRVLNFTNEAVSLPKSFPIASVQLVDDILPSEQKVESSLQPTIALDSEIKFKELSDLGLNVQ